jgi:hypothetical protein
MEGAPREVYDGFTVFFLGKLTKCGHLEVKTFHLASLILSL